jgi:hypothetical protein
VQVPRVARSQPRSETSAGVDSLKHPRTGELAVEVAYGTTNLKLDLNLPMQLMVTHPQDIRDAGLKHPTRFDLKLTKILPCSKEFFVELRRGQGPIIGRLSAHGRMDLNEVVKNEAPKPTAAKPLSQTQTQPGGATSPGGNGKSEKPATEA